MGLLEENILSGVEPDIRINSFRNKPCEALLKIKQEDYTNRQIHKIQKQVNRKDNTHTPWIQYVYLLGKKYIDLETKVLSYNFLLTFVVHISFILLLDCFHGLIFNLGGKIKTQT